MIEMDAEQLTSLAVLVGLPNRNLPRGTGRALIGPLWLGKAERRKAAKLEVEIPQLKLERRK